MVHPGVHREERKEAIPSPENEREVTPSQETLQAEETQQLVIKIPQCQVHEKEAILSLGPEVRHRGDLR